MYRQICLMMLIGSLSFAGCSKGQSTDTLIEDSHSPEVKDRLGAVRQLQSRKGDAAKVLPVLIESLQDKNVDVRISAAIGLGYFGAEAKSALPDLEKAQSDKDARVRNAVRAAISRIGPEDKHEDKDNASKS